MEKPSAPRSLVAATCLLSLGAASGAAREGSLETTIPAYQEHADFLLAPPGALETGLLGYANPALLKYVHQPDLLLALSDPRGPAQDLKRYGLFAAAPGLGLGYVHERTALGAVSDFRAAAAFGSRAFSTGLGLRWSTGDTSLFARTTDLHLGLLVRPSRALSLGFFGAKALNGGSAEGVADLALRPLRTSLLTLSADYAWRDRSAPQARSWSVGGVLEPLPGLRLTTRYFKDHRFTTGLGLSLGHAGVSAQNHYDRDRRREYSTYTVRLGAYDRNVFDRRLRRGTRYLALDLHGSLPYRTAALFGGQRTFAGLYRVLSAAEADPRVAGVVINASGLDVDRQRLWELRAMLEHFRATGRHVIIGIDNADLSLYHFASIADRVVMDPQGLLTLAGYARGRTFYKSALEKAGVGFDEWRFFKYKSALEPFSQERMSAADREQRQAMVDQALALARQEICAARSLKPETLDALVGDEVIVLARRALAAKLVDAVGRWGEHKSWIKELEGRAKRVIQAGDLLRFQEPPDARWGERPRIALVYAIGACAMDEGIRARKLVLDLRAALADPSIRAIVLRVDSPGGDALASDLIADEMRRARGRKPIIVSQGMVAASGGYWLSMYADAIVATPETLTGSIGVIGGWFYNAGLKEKLGLSTDLVQAGKHADLGLGFTLPFLGLGLPDRNLDAGERARAQAVIEELYRQFVDKVAEGRRKTPDEVAALAQGRVWTGQDALRLGLVDGLGGLDTAVALAKQKAGLAPGAEVALVELPKRPFLDLSALRRVGRTQERSNLGPLARYLRFRLVHNGAPLALLPFDEIDDALVERAFGSEDDR